MVSQTRGQSNRSSDEARASTSQTMLVGNPPNIVDPIESGHVSERKIANGNGATNPDETHGSDASDSSDESESDDSNIRMALDEQIAQATQTRDRLRKQRQLENINREIAALEQGHQAESDVEPNPPLETHATGSKRPSDEVLIRASKRRNIKPKELPEYHGKSRQEHREWVRDADVAFALTPWNFDDEEDKILWAMQSLKGDPKEQWHNECARAPVIASSWEYFTNFLLDKVEDPVNRQLDINQEFTDAKQRPSQSVAAFDAYLTSLEAQLPPFTESQRTSALMTRLRPELQEAIIRIGTLPVDRNALLLLAACLETTTRRSHARSSQGQWQGGASTGGHKGSNRSNNSKPSQEERTVQSKKDKKENRKPGSGSKFKSKSKDKEWLKNIECFSCHKKGHYATDCRAPKTDGNPNNVPVGLIGNIGAHAVELSNSGKGKSSSKTP